MVIDKGNIRTIKSRTTQFLFLDPSINIKWKDEYGQLYF